MQDFEFILFFTIAVSFIVYVSGLAGYTILDSNVGGLELTEFSADPFSVFGVFFALMFTTSIYAVLGIVLFVPYGLALTYLALKWLRGTG